MKENHRQIAYYCIWLNEFNDSEEKMVGAGEAMCDEREKAGIIAQWHVSHDTGDLYDVTLSFFSPIRLGLRSGLVKKEKKNPPLKFIQLDFVLVW